MDHMVAGKCTGDHVQRRRTMELGGDGLERERGKGEWSRWTASSPRGRWRGRWGRRRDGGDGMVPGVDRPARTGMQPMPAMHGSPARFLAGGGGERSGAASYRLRSERGGSRRRQSNGGRRRSAKQGSRASEERNGEGQVRERGRGRARAA